MATARRRSNTQERAVRPPELSAADVAAALARVRAYAAPYRARMDEEQQGLHLEQMLAGLTSSLERKSTEPIALMHGVPRHHLQHFIGQSSWDEKPLRQLQWKEVHDELGQDDGALVIDGSATPKKGTATVGVARQWCGRLGKVESCVLGVYGVYVGKEEHAVLVDSQLYLPEAWAKDRARREAAKIPPQASYRTVPELAKEMLFRLDGPLRFSWVLGDDELGRVKGLRDLCFLLGKNYILDVPENTVMVRVKTSGRLGRRSYTARELSRRWPKATWEELWVRDGEKGPLEVRALAVPVATARGAGRVVAETLVVIETRDGSQRWYCLAKTHGAVGLAELVRRARQRHHAERVFGEAKGEVGLDHFEVRSWLGWHHHMTLCQLAHWFLVREKRRLGEKSRGADGEPGAAGARPAAVPAAERGAKRRAGQLPPATEPRGEGGALSRPRSLTDAAPLSRPRERT
jgi:SRSO17 transposase